MPGRIAVARRQLAGTEVALIQVSLDLARDVRLAHADWVLAHARLELREAMASQSAELLAIATARSEFGELSELDRETARAVAATAVDELERARTDLALAESRLRTRLGWGLDAPFSGPLKVQDEPLTALPGAPLVQLEGEAQSRPAFEAAQLEVDRAQTQLRLERAAMVNVAAVGQTNGPKLQLGPQLVLPIFDQNQAGRARARAALDAARWRQRALRERVVAEVREAHAVFEQASTSQRRYEAEIVDSRARALAAATESYELGEHDFAPVLLAADQLAVAQLRLAELEAEVRRAHANLERALGGRLSAGLDPGGITTTSQAAKDSNVTQ
jgi:cobalt-zinc-cadmium efflux system outer membrane protein